jgi:hypothetical protein
MTCKNPPHSTHEFDSSLFCTYCGRSAERISREHGGVPAESVVCLVRLKMPQGGSGEIQAVPVQTGATAIMKPPYSFCEQDGEYSYEITFATHAELMLFVREFWRGTKS